MTMHANLHNAAQADHYRSGGAEWVTIRDNHNNSVAIFLPFEKAKAIAAIINDETVTP